MINSQANSDTVQNNNSEHDSQELKPISSLTFPFKSFEYHTVREILIPFNTNECNNAKFHTPMDAMMYIRDHCLKHNIAFKRSTVMKYAHLCQVYNQPHGSYICMGTLSQSVLNRLYTKVSRLYSTKVMKEFIQ